MGVDSGFLLSCGFLSNQEGAQCGSTTSEGHGWTLRLADDVMLSLGLLFTGSMASDSEVQRLSSHGDNDRIHFRQLL